MIIDDHFPNSHNFIEKKRTVTLPRNSDPGPIIAESKQFSHILGHTSLHVSRCFSITIMLKLFFKTF